MYYYYLYFSFVNTTEHSFTYFTRDSGDSELLLLTRDSVDSESKTASNHHVVV